MRGYLRFLRTVAARRTGIRAAQAEASESGFNVPLTGFAAADGKSALTGAELAVDQANADGGVDGQVELVVYDDQASPKEAAPIANKLASQDKVNIAISGSYSGASARRPTYTRRTAFPTSRPMRSIPDITGPAASSSAPPSSARSRDGPAPS